MKTRPICVMLFFSIALVACGPKAPTDEERETPALQDSVTPTATTIPTNVPVMDLELTFDDSDWDGKTVPVGQQCQSQGGDNPSTPRIIVSSIPEGSNAIVLEFSDRDYRPMDDGGHGKIGFLILEGTKEAVIPSIPGHSFNLPNDFFIIQEHQASSFDTAGAYMPPCSGGIGNSYYVTVKAVMLISEEDKTYTLLGQGTLELGKY